MRPPISCATMVIYAVGFMAFWLIYIWPTKADRARDRQRRKFFRKGQAMTRTYEEKLRDARAAAKAVSDEIIQKATRTEVLRQGKDAFLADIEAVCRKHNMSISHEDAHGGFLIEEFDEYNLDWLKAAEPH